LRAARRVVALFLILPLIALVSLVFSVLVLAKSPRSFGVRVGVALAVDAVGCALLVLFFIGLSALPTGE